MTAILDPENIPWGWPGASRKAHIFEDSTSLCRRWFWTGEAQPGPLGMKPGLDDCTPCWRKAQKRIIAQQEATS